MQKPPLRISITTGDPDGIGSEVTAKALFELGPKRGVHLYLWRSPDCPKAHLKLIDRQFERVTVATWEDALSVPQKNHKVIVDIASSLSPAHWVETSAKACNSKLIDGMATAPLSKTAIRNAGFSDIGHTDILKRVSGIEELFMTFIGDRFNVLLVTDHIPLSLVPESVTIEKIVSAAKAANAMRPLLDRKFRNKPLGILGLNPHSGEEGLIGREEKNISKLYLKLKQLSISAEGPLVPDAAFFNQNHAHFSFYLALYHDQGLIPFKMIHGQDTGVHITAGLPFVRTSVDHGTAKDLFGKNKANPNSMLQSIRWCIELCRKNVSEKA